MRQVLPDQPTAQERSLEVFARLMQAHASLQRVLNAQLQADHGLTVTDYGVLLRLARTPEHRLRRTDLAEATALTASGITRLLGGLEAAGLVKTVACEADRRVSWAVLTDVGRKRLTDASPGHLAAIRAVLGERYSDDELSVLAELLSRLPGVDASGESCSAG
jgi:DNA-binding MarR family transcriptional regulator